MADLHIPDAAIDEVREIADEHDDTLRAQARAIAAPVVAAELRRLAAEWKQKAADLSPMDSGWHAAMHQQAARLLRRADELDPPQSGGDPA